MKFGGKKNKDKGGVYMNDEDYQNYCQDIVERIVTNQKHEEEISTKLFNKTTENYF